MGRNLHRGIRCQRCKMRHEVCICSLLEPIGTKTRVSILMHHRELVTTTNTARIACELLENSEIHVRGLINEPLSKDKILKKDFSPIYLYPSENARLLTFNEINKLKHPIQLIVPDGSWRQTKKFSKREEFLNEIPHFILPLDKPSLFFLRKKVKINGMSTFEAIARALGVIESTDIQEKMEKVFYEMIEKTLQTRGQNILNHQNRTTELI